MPDIDREQLAGVPDGTSLITVEDGQERTEVVVYDDNGWHKEAES